MVPEGWRSCRLGDFFESRREKGWGDLPTMSVTLNDGLVLRDSLDRKTETNLAAEQHLLVRHGDIAYNMMRMWQGASGLAEFDALVSPAYVVLRPKAGIDPLFASYFFKAARTVYLFWAYSYGLTSDRLRLYFPDFCLVPVVVPPIEEQERIGRILKTWDQAIDALTQLADNAIEEKRALMQAFFSSTESRRWAEVELRSLGTFRKGKGIGREQVINDGLPCVTYGEIYTRHHTAIRSIQSFILPNVAFESSEIHKGDILFAGSGETPEEIGKCAAFLEDHPAYAGGDIVIFSPREVDSLFLAYQLNHSAVIRQRVRYAQGHSIVHISASNLGKFKVRVPTRTRQERIATILGDVDRVIDNCNEQKQLLIREKRSLMQQLLTGKRRVCFASTEGKIACA